MPRCELSSHGLRLGLVLTMSCDGLFIAEELVVPNWGLEGGVFRPHMGEVLVVVTRCIVHHIQRDMINDCVKLSNL